MSTNVNSGDMGQRKVGESSLERRIQDSKRKKTSSAKLAVIIFAALGGVTYIGGFLLVNLSPSLRDEATNYLFVLGALFLFILAIVSGIVCKITSLRTTKVNRLNTIAVIVFLTIVLGVASVVFLQQALPYIYTPAALTAENLAVFSTCIDFVREHDEYKNLALARWGWVSITGDHFYLLHSRSPWEKTRNYFSENEINELQRLAEQLHRVRCHKFQRDSGMVLFYKTTSPFPPLQSKGYKVWSSFLADACALLSPLPVAPGMLYSLNGKNPNEISSEVLNVGKPFIQIAGNWYMSRRLNLKGMRSDTPYSVPKSLIDRSLRIDGIEPDDLYIKEGGWM